MAKIFSEPSAGAAPPGVARRSPPTRIGRPEVNLNSFCQARPKAVPISGAARGAGQMPRTRPLLVTKRCLTVSPRLTETISQNE